MLMELLYIISSAIAFTYKYDGVLVSYWLKYIISMGWIILWLLIIMHKNGTIEGTNLFYIKNIIMPYVYIGGLSVVLWIINRLAVFDSSYVSRSISSILCLCISMFTAIAVSYIFKRRVIQLSVYAIVLSTCFNVVRAIQIYGMGTFLDFVRTAWLVTDFDVTRPTFGISQMLEVHDATIAAGFFIIYYLFFSKDTKKKRIVNTILLLICAYLGFKRAAFMGILAVAGLLFILRKKGNYKKAINITGIIITIAAFAYIIAIKIGIAEIAAIALNIDFSGRFIIYDVLARYYSVSPLYLGTGYGYINKLFEDMMGLASHADIIRMYIELGFIPYCVWLWHFLFSVPKKVLNNYGKEAAQVILASSLYVFVVYFVGNAMTLHCIQFSYALLPVALSYSEETNVPKKFFRIGSMRI